MIPLLQGATAAPWPAAAVHDTVAAIARQAAYRRKLTDTLWQKIFRWIGELLGDIFDALTSTGFGRPLVIGLAVVLVVLIVARVVIAARAAHDSARQGGARVRRLLGNDPWGDAERFAAAGRYTEAAHALFAALLSVLAARGEIRFHASKTAGDYARELRRGGAGSYAGFQAFRARYDRVVYGAGVCTADDYAALLRDARPLLALKRAA